MDSDGSGLSPEAAFRVLGEETRMAILRAVWEAPAQPVSFTELRERVGNPDSGQFNYHLDKLRGHFLRVDDDGYELTQAGREVVRAVLAGTMTERPETEPVAIDGACTECGGGLVARYDEYGIVECGECEAPVMWNEFPPAGLSGRDPSAVAVAFDRWTRSRFRLAMDGICPNCAAEMTTTLPDPGEGEGDEVATEHRCENCKYEARVPLYAHAVYSPAVVSFLYERGVDVTGMPYWRLRELARESIAESVSVDPWRARIAIESEGETLSLVFDDRLELLEIDSQVTE